MKQKQVNVYVLDTSVLINDPDILFKLGNNRIVVPTAVIQELDGLKRSSNPDEPRSRAARKVTRTLDRLSRYNDITGDSRASSQAGITIFSRRVAINDLASNADNRIVGAALKLREESHDNVILVTADGNMRIISRSYGLKAEDYPSLRRPHLTEESQP